MDSIPIIYVAGVPISRLPTRFPYVMQHVPHGSAALTKASIAEFEKMKALMRSCRSPMESICDSASYFAILNNYLSLDRARKKTMRTAGLHALKCPLYYQFFTGEKNVEHSY